MSLHPSQLPAWLAERVEVVVCDDGLACWRYKLGWNSGNGYSKCKRDGAARLVHRLTWTLLRGPICRFLLLDHLVCKRRWCCNPEHLDPVFSVVNTRRGGAVLYAAGRPHWSR